MSGMTRHACRLQKQYGGKIMVIETNRVNGALVVYAIINGYLEQQMYIGYSKRDAIKAFKQHYNLK